MSKSFSSFTLLCDATVHLLHLAVLYCTVLYCTVLYCIVLYCAILYCVLYRIVLYCTVLYCTVLYRIVPYCTVVYGIVVYGIVLYCTVVYLPQYHECKDASAALEISDIGCDTLFEGSLCGTGGILQVRFCTVVAIAALSAAILVAVSTTASV